MKDHSRYICWSKSDHLLFISNWNIRENFSPRLVAPGRLWSLWEAPSSPHLAPGGCLEGQPPEDRLAMIPKKRKKTFRWSRPSPSFQLIKTWTKSSTVILSNPLSFTTSLQASFTCTYLLSAQGEFIKSSFADLTWSFHPHSSNLTASCKYTKVYEKLILKFSFSV